MNEMKRSNPPRNSYGMLVLAMLLVASGGILYGQYCNRWGEPQGLLDAAEQVEAIPKQIGPWIMVEESRMPSSTTEMLQCAGHINRKYLNEHTGDKISLAVIVGRPGPIAVHTPEICYSSRAYQLSQRREEIRMRLGANNSDAFWRVDFDSKNFMADDLRVYYAWSDGGPWRASQSPRFEFASATLLYKLQLATSLSPVRTDLGSAEQVGALRQDSDPAIEFLHALGELELFKKG